MTLRQVGYLCIAASLACALAACSIETSVNNDSGLAVDARTMAADEFLASVRGEKLAAIKDSNLQAALRSLRVDQVASVLWTRRAVRWTSSGSTTTLVGTARLTDGQRLRLTIRMHAVGNRWQVDHVNVDVDGHRAPAAKTS